MNKKELLTEIQAGYACFSHLLAELDSDEIHRPGVIGGWSVKDVLAHLAVHQQRMVAWVRGRLQGEMPSSPQPYAMPEDELAHVNRLIWEENRARPLADVLEDLQTAHRSALDLVDGASEGELIDPSRLHLMGGEPLWEAVAANTYWHYQEHSVEIAIYVQKVRERQ